MKRSDVPAPIKRAGRTVAVAVGQATSILRRDPDLLITGGNRCGTTALHRALIEHPLVAPPMLHKGVNYFDLHYHRGRRWYRGHLPTRIGAQLRSRQFTRRPVVVESSGYYLDHPLAVGRIAHDLPAVKLIVMLRDPVERAHSAYRHNVARGMESLSFEEVIDLEPERHAGEQAKILADPTYESYADRHQSPVRRSQYADRIAEYFERFGRERVHVLFSEDFERHPEREFDAVLDFLDLPPFRPRAGFGRWNASPPADLLPATRRRLEDHFAPYDERLAALLERPLPWRNAQPVDVAGSLS